MILSHSSLEIPFDQLIPGISLVISVVAASVGFLVLWFTVLKGPDIDLVPVELSFRPTNIHPDYHLDSIPLMPVEMLFLNNGSKTGAVTDIKAEFTPSTAFRRFYKEFTQRIEVKSSASEFKLLPAIVPERGTAIVSLELSINLKPWKDLSRLTDFGDRPLSEALRLIWKEGQAALTGFSNLRDPIGIVDIKAKRTRRRRRKIVHIDDVVASDKKLEALPDWARSQARTSLSNFHRLRKSDAEMARDIRRIPDSFMGDYNQNITILSPGNIGEMKQLQTTGPTQLSNRGEWETPLQHVLSHESAFRENMEAYYEDMDKYNERILPVAPMVQADAERMQWLVKLRADLFTRTQAFHQELLELKAKLIAETEHLAGQSNEE